MATVWLDADLDALLRLAHLKDVVARDVNKPTLHAQITALEDRLGLSPGARRKLQWEIAQADPGEDHQASVRYLRAVDAK
ncbi:MAG: hypothetical protein ACRDNE_00570 [Gaiellaceae bacterium]